MKRHQELQDLSREHHRALALALKLSVPMSLNPATIKATGATSLTAFRTELDHHLVVEETTLLSPISVCKPVAD